MILSVGSFIEPIKPMNREYWIINDANFKSFNLIKKKKTAIVILYNTESDSI